MSRYSSPILACLGLLRACHPADRHDRRQQKHSRKRLHYAERFKTSVAHGSSRGRRRNHGPPVHGDPCVRRHDVHSRRLARVGSAKCNRHAAGGVRLAPPALRRGIVSLRHLRDRCCRRLSSARPVREAIGVPSLRVRLDDRQHLLLETGVQHREAEIPGVANTQVDTRATLLVRPDRHLAKVDVAAHKAMHRLVH